MKQYLRVLSFFLVLPFTFSVGLQAQSTLKSPSEYLGYELGSRFTPHYKVLAYVTYVAEHSPLVKLEPYGSTNEGRELVIVEVSSEANMNRLQEIRTDNLKRVGFLEGEPVHNHTVIVWLSYNVHGNEASSSEAAMKTLYELARPGNHETKRWLQNAVVVIDPMLNPDGRDRYVHWYNETVGDMPNVHIDAREHHEPWPGGRTNHYYFDLNRDWAWLTQKESRERLAIYQKWMPQVHVDFHEQEYNSPYYFAPAAESFHDAITDWERQFQDIMGQHNARYFDQHHWLYFTREIFDLFYPSYGDTYPLFNGAIGMTYEQGGHSMAGLKIIKEEGDTLSLYDRFMHHSATGLATVEVSSEHANELVDHFRQYYQDAVHNPDSPYKTFVIKGDNDPFKIKMLCMLLDEQHIKYGRIDDPKKLNGYHYATGKQERITVTASDYLVSVYQPKSVLTRVLFEPRPELVDSVTYDITAWALPYAYGLDAYALKDHLRLITAANSGQTVNNSFNGKPYAYLAEWKDLNDIKLLAALLQKNINIRFAENTFSIGGKSYKPGTLIITRNGNENLGDKFDQEIRKTATELQLQLSPVTSGRVKSGSDFGSETIHHLKKPRVALFSGEGTISNRVGEIWHYFDRQINYPVTLIDADYFPDIDLKDYDVLILPSGNYGELMKSKDLNRIKNWIQDGGKLIALEEANEWLAGKGGFALVAKDSTETSKIDIPYESLLRVFGLRECKNVSESNPGSIYKINMDPTHPLAFGYDSTYFTLKLNADAYAYLRDGWNVGVIKENALMSGFVGYKAKKQLKNTLVFGVQTMGRGSIVYMVDNPLFRAFWYNGKLLFGNAVFLVGQ